MSLYLPYQVFKQRHTNVRELPRIDLKPVANHFDLTPFQMLFSISGDVKNHISDILQCDWTIRDDEIIISKRSSWELARLIWL